MYKINRKKLMALGLSLGLGFALVSCSDNSTSTTTPDSSSSSNSTDSTAPNPSPEVSTDVATVEGFTTVEDGLLIMTTNAAFPPYEMVADGEGIAQTGFEGIDVEIAAAIAEELGLTLEIMDMDFSAALASPGLGKSDIVMAGVTVNEERMRNMDFSNSYSTGVQVVIVPEDSALETIDDLYNEEGLQVGTQEGTTGYIYASDTVENGGFGDENVLAVANGSLAVESLLAGKVDCVIIDNAPAQSFVNSVSGLRILDIEFAVEEYAIGMAKGNTALQSAINDALESLSAQGTIDEIVGKYIN